MRYFCIHDHPQLPVVTARLERRRRDTTKDGFRLRYVLPLGEEAAANADTVIGRLDEAMGGATKGHGVYQAKYGDVRAAYDSIIGSIEDDPRPSRALALMTAIALALAMSLLIPPLMLGFAVVTAFKRQSGFAAMAEATILFDIFDWRPTIARLINHWRHG